MTVFKWQNNFLYNSTIRQLVLKEKYVVWQFIPSAAFMIILNSSDINIVHGIGIQSIRIHLQTLTSMSDKSQFWHLFLIAAPGTVKPII